jgi:hypothetical protein
VRKRFTAISVALATLPVAVMTAVATAPPAGAVPGPNCGAYPSGQSFGMAVSQSAQQIRRGGSVTLHVALTRGGEACTGKSVNIYVHGPSDWSRWSDCRGSVTGRCSNNQFLHHFSASAITDGNGVAHKTYTNVLADFRWFGFYYVNNAEAVRARGIGGSQSGPLGAKSSAQNLVDVIP